MLPTKILTKNNEIIKFIKDLKIDLYLKNVQLTYLVLFIMSTMIKGFKGRMTDISESLINEKHRTSIGRFLSNSNWNEDKILKIYQKSIKSIIWNLSFATKKDIFVIIDDTISKKSKPSSKAKNPIEKAGYHRSHTEKKTVFGHQFVITLLQCGAVKLPYSIVLYDKSKMSKIEIAKDIISSMPTPVIRGSILADSWYSCKDIIKASIDRGYSYIGAIKTNRVIYPQRFRMSMNISGFAKTLKEDQFDLVTVKKSKYYVYRYIGKINSFKKVVILITYPEDKLLKKSAIKAFICTDISIETEHILNSYADRWNIEVFIRTSKMLLGLNNYQVRNYRAIKRYTIIMIISYFYIASKDNNYNFIKSLKILRNETKEDFVFWIFTMATKEKRSYEYIRNVVLKAS